MTTTLTDWLLARIDDDEAAARMTRPEEYLSTRDSSELWIAEAGGYSHVGATSGRVLAEVAAKRAIVEEHGGRAPFHVDPCDESDIYGHSIPCATLRHLAAVYSDCDGYDESWRP